MAASQPVKDEAGRTPVKVEPGTHPVWCLFKNAGSRQTTLSTTAVDLDSSPSPPKKAKPDPLTAAPSDDTSTVAKARTASPLSKEKRSEAEQPSSKEQRSEAEPEADRFKDNKAKSNSFYSKIARAPQWLQEFWSTNLKDLGRTDRGRKNFIETIASVDGNNFDKPSISFYKKQYLERKKGTTDGWQSYAKFIKKQRTTAWR